MSTLYFGGTILTMDDACPQVEAILVRDGRIFKRGTLEAIRSFCTPDTILYDLQGKTMLPGFLDGHSHFAGLATSLDQCDLSRAKNFDDICRLLKAFIQENAIPSGTWVVGTNYDHNFLQERLHPNRFLLDQVSQSHPIVITHASSHMGVANSKALSLQSLTNPSDPSGGRYGRTEDGRLDGYMEENAFVAFRNAMPMPDIGALMNLFRKAQEIYASNGITTVQEGMVTAPLLELLKYAQKSGVLYLDLVGYQDLESLDSIPPEARQYQNHFRIGGYKIFLDGSPQGKTAWMQDPYAGEERYRGYPIKDDPQLYALIFKALQNHQQLLAHCNGDAAAEQYVTQFEAVLQDHPDLTPCRPVMIHAQLVKEEQLGRMKKISMIPSFFTAHSYYWGDIHLQNFGRNRASNISPAATALALGLPFTFHQDSPVLPPNVLETLWCAANRITKAGAELNREERISIAQGLKAVTINAAYQYGEENAKGSLEEGKLADLVILSDNPLEVENVRKIQVVETVKGGETVYKR